MSEAPVTVQGAAPFFTVGAIDPKELGEAGPFFPPPDFEQNQTEFFWLIAQIGRPASVLEIGSREGGFLKKISQYMEPGGKICCIDIGLPHPEWQNGRDTVPHLRDAIMELRNKGFDAQAFVGDSQTDEAIEWAKARGPFDFIHIDGDHTYLGVREDWDNYKDLGKTVAFHDIKETTARIGLTGVSRLWENIKKRGHHTEEMTAPDGTGIGVVRL